MARSERPLVLKTVSKDSKPEALSQALAEARAVAAVAFKEMNSGSIPNSLESAPISALEETV